MLLLLDECTTRTVELVFRERNHDVHYVVDELAPETPDHVVAAYAHQHSAVVVTWNYKHYKTLMTRRRSSGEWAFPNMGLIGFQCPEVDGPTRLRAFIELIERECEYVQSMPGQRLSVLIGWDQFRIYR